MIKTIRPASMTIEKFRNFKNIRFNLGKQITLISGQNGVGKSNLLSLIASSSGLNKKSALGSNFQPDFNDFFSIDQSERFSEYSLYVDFNDDANKQVLRKKLTFKDDTSRNRGIRIIPRTSRFLSDDTRTVREVEKEAKDKFGVGGAARVPVPTIYLSISRLYPLGEKKDNVSVKEYARKNSLYQMNANTVFSEWYNKVIPNSIKAESQLSIIEKAKISRRASFHMEMYHTPALSQSVGQDNLGNIISALVDVYLLSQQADYQGALVCIDEVDVSLHPDTQIRLLELMDLLAKELNIQFVLTTHSLTCLKEIAQKQEKNPEDYVIVYLKNPSMPYVQQKNGYYALKADLFNNMTYNPPVPKVYFEDRVGESLFRMLIESLEDAIDKVKTTGWLRDKNGRSEEINKQLLELESIMGIEKKLKLMPVEVGCDQLINLSNIDKYFKRVIMVLDGDVRIKNGKDVMKPSVCDYLERWYEGKEIRKHDRNICFFPGYFPPESFLYKIIYFLVKNQGENYMFWRSLDSSEETCMYTVDKISEKIMRLSGKFTNDDIKKLFNEEMWQFISKSHLLKYYYGSYKTVEPLIKFGNDFINAYKIAKMLTLQNKYS